MGNILARWIRPKEDSREDVNEYVEGRVLKRLRFREFCMAFFEEDFKTMRRLVDEEGVDVNAFNEFDDTVPLLEWACQRGRLDLARRLVFEFHAEVDSEGDDGWTPFMYACQGGHLDVVRFLVEEGAAYDWNYWNPLKVACSSDRLEVVQYLVSECGVDVNDRNIDGKMAIDDAKSHEMINYILANVSPWSRVPEPWRGG